MANRRKQQKFKVILTIITFIVFGLVIYAVRDQISDTVDNLMRVNLWLVALIIPLAFLNHIAIGKVFQHLFRILGDRFRTRSMTRLSLELNFVNNVFPSAGVSGFSYIGLRLKEEDVRAGRSALVQVMRLALVYISFQLLLGLGLLVLAIGGNVNNFVIMVAASLITLLFVGTALGVFVISSKERINGFFTGLTRALNRVIQVIRTKEPETINIGRVERIFTDLHNNYQSIRHNLPALKRPFLYAFGSNVIEVASVYVAFLAFGVAVNPGSVILAYAVANFAGVISVLPGGIGVYEILMTGVLVATGVPIALSLPAIVMFRIVSMMAQLPAGYYFYQKNIQEQLGT